MLNTGRRIGALGMVLPLLIWSGHLLFVYGLLGVICARAAEAGAAVLPVLWLVSALAVAALLFIGFALARRLRGEYPLELHFALFAGLVVSGLSLVAVVWATLPLLFVAPCG